MKPRTLKPCALALSSRISRSALAPSVSGELFAGRDGAVLACRTTGLSLAYFSSSPSLRTRLSSRIVSSKRFGTKTSITSSSNLPSSQAFAASAWLRCANSSCACAADVVFFGHLLRALTHREAGRVLLDGGRNCGAKSRGRRPAERLKTLTDASGLRGFHERFGQVASSR